MTKNKTKLNRRELVKMFGMGSAAGLISLFGTPLSVAAKEKEKAKNFYARTQIELLQQPFTPLPLSSELKRLLVF